MPVALVAEDFDVIERGMGQFDVSGSALAVQEFVLQR